MKRKRFLSGALGLGTAALLAGCSQSPGTPNAGSERPAYVLSVPAAEGDTAQTLEARYGGTVLALHPEAGTALMGLNREAAQARTLRAQDLTDGLTADPNLNTFSAGALAMMGGSRSFWMGGEWQAWAGGSRSFWMGGDYTPVLQNSFPFRQIKLERAHQLAPKLGAGVKVAVIDTGIDLNHPAFNGALAPAGEWKDFYSNDNVPQDEGTLGVNAGTGHGTAVASIVLQVAPKATILPIRVLGPNGEGDTLQVANAIYYAASMGARVINLSLGSAEKSDTVEQAVKFVTEKKNILVVSSAGNDNRNAITYPAMYAVDGADGERSLSVGSVDASDRKSVFSNYQKDKLEIMAPGENIFAAGPGGLLVSWSGTSMAAPIVAGGLALALGQTLSVDIKDVTKKMAENGQDLYNNGNNSGFKDMLGKGRLNLEQFLTIVVKN